MLQKVIRLCVSGERPTRAGLYSRAEVSASSAAGNGPWGENQVWSKRSRHEVVRSRRAC